jgi:pyruvate,water dikinase
MTSTQEASELRFDPPGPGFFELDPVHFPRPLTRYWAEIHPAAFERGTSEFARFYGMLIGGLGMAYINGFAYKIVLPVPEGELPQRFERAKEVLAGKLWREQLREWDESF